MNTKTVLITGASRGIGQAIARAFAKKHYNIVITSSKSPDELTDTKNIVTGMGCQCLDFLCDAGSYDDMSKTFEKINEHFGGVDILVNNAGISYIGLLTDMTPQDWNQMVSTNLSSVFNCCHLAIPHMVHQKEGKIVNISSVWGCIGASCEVAYSATKGGVNSFTMALAKELAPSNIQVNAVACGAIDTSMNSFLAPEEKDALIEEIPTGRLGTAKEVADFVFEICHNNSYLTGQVIRLDGGWC